MFQGRRLGGAKRRIAAVDDALQVVARDLVGRYVQRQDLEGKVGECEVLPALPIAGGGNFFGDEQSAIGGETL